MNRSKCISCDIASGSLIPDGGFICRGNYFNAHQDIAYPIPGFVILASNRHFKCLDEMTDEESLEWLQLLRKIRRAQRDFLKISEVYYFQNEDTKHHFHTWMVPRYEWMKPFGKSIESVRPALLHSRENFKSKEEKESVLRAVESLKLSLK